jgi:hypothetical protein
VFSYLIWSCILVCNYLATCLSFGLLSHVYPLLFAYNDSNMFHVMLQCQSSDKYLMNFVWIFTLLLLTMILWHCVFFHTSTLTSFIHQPSSAGENLQHLPCTHKFHIRYTIMKCLNLLISIPHLCACGDCLMYRCIERWRLCSNRCPICRHPIEF